MCRSTLISSSGGFTNLHLAYRGNTETLPEAQAREVKRLVESSCVFGLQQDDINPNAAIGRTDRISDRLTLSEGSRHTLWMNDLTAPASVRPLLEFPQKLAVEQERTGT